MDLSQTAIPLDSNPVPFDKGDGRPLGKLQEIFQGDCRPLGKLQEIFQGDIKETPSIFSGAFMDNFPPTMIIQLPFSQKNNKSYNIYDKNNKKISLDKLSINSCISLIIELESIWIQTLQKNEFNVGINWAAIQLKIYYHYDNIDICLFSDDSDCSDCGDNNNDKVSVFSLSGPDQSYIPPPPIFPPSQHKKAPEKIGKANFFGALKEINNTNFVPSVTDIQQKILTLKSVKQIQQGKNIIPNNVPLENVLNPLEKINMIGALELQNKIMNLKKVNLNNIILNDFEKINNNLYNQVKMTKIIFDNLINKYN